jgi:hypothetical protein
MVQLLHGHFLIAAMCFGALGSVQSDNASIRLYFGNGCFFAHQHLLVQDFEQKVLGRGADAVTAINGYAGSTQTGANGTACYHNQQNFSDYGVLGDAEVVEVDVPLASLDKAFAVYFGSFLELQPGMWARPDVFDMGAQYRALVGVPGGLANARVLEAMQRANVHNMTLQAGQGSDPDTLVNNNVYVMDTTKFSFIQAELCLQFHDDVQTPYPPSYHELSDTLGKNGRLLPTQCPPNFICSSSLVAAQPDYAILV